MTERAALPLPAPGAVVGVRVFLRGDGGGNPVPLVADARGLSTEDMQAIARHHGHESAFLLPPTTARADWRLRYFVPRHEMEMCGHATVGSFWALRQWGLWRAPTATVETLSGLVEVQWDDARRQAWISQPRATLEPVSQPDRVRIASVLGLAGAGAIRTVVNAATSRVKTLVEMPGVEALQRLAPDFPRMEALCADIGSTGLYPYALDMEDTATVFARQFPKSSGYPEDPATGIAASALWGHLAAAGVIDAGSPDTPAITQVRQGDAMGSPSAIDVRPRFDADGVLAGCWLSGRVDWTAL